MPLFPIPPTSTPDDSPASHPPSSLGSRKKVGFSSLTDVHEPAGRVNQPDNVSIRPLPPSRECSTSSKSILKANGQVHALLSITDGPGDEKQSLNDTMESILQQLARNETAECVDAYQTLASAVKAYDELPEQIVLRSKLHAITKSIKQHLAALDQPDPQPCDINLVTSALKVLVILVWNDDFSSFLSDDFRLFVLDRAITTVVEHKAPKSVIVHYLHLLATQDFRQGLLTPARMTRLLDGLALLTEHVKGNGVVSERLLVYHKLLDQVKPLMKMKAGSWVEHMVSAMISAIPDTRTKALALGRKACQSFPASDSIANIAKSVLADVQDDNKTKGYAMCKKLEKMAAIKESAEHVPQIWAVMILLCSSDSVRIDTWSGLKQWLMVIQRCFNSSDVSLRLQANLAWNRFVYVARPQEASDGLLAMLAKPVVAQLERCSADKIGKASHFAAVSSYCNLLYYAFRPATSSARLTKAWNEYIVKVMRSSFFEKNPANADMACRILMALLWNTKTGTKVWNEKRAHENRVVEPDELPTIDAKWVRSHGANIINIFELLFRYSSWGFQEPSEQAYISKAWRHFVKSVRSASSKEIKMSSETRACVLAILGYIAKLSNGRGQPGALSGRVLHTIAATVVAELGVAHVLEALDTDRGAPTATIHFVVLDHIESKLQATDSPSKQLIDTLAKYIELLDSCLAREYTTGPKTSHEMETLASVTSRALSMIPSAHIDTMLMKMPRGLPLWLKDKHQALSGPSLEGFARAFTQAAVKIRSESLGPLDDLFTAAFGSSHATLVSTMARGWNADLGDRTDLELPMHLSDALKELSRYLELKLPAGFPTLPRADNNSLPAYNTQLDNEADAAVPLENESEVETDTENNLEQEQIDASVGHDPVAEEAMAEIRRPRSGSRSRRHDDSQIDFVAVDSSPMAVNLESQCLTDRQKEVRDRQRGEPAVVFPDLRSSPRPASRAASESRDCGFARKAATMVDRPATPIPDPAEDADIQPSPTPKSRFLRNMAEVEIPSSPPSQCGGQEKNSASEAYYPGPVLHTGQEAEVEHVDVIVEDEEVFEKLQSSAEAHRDSTGDHAKTGDGTENQGMMAPDMEKLMSPLVIIPIKSTASEGGKLDAQVNQTQAQTHNHEIASGFTPSLPLRDQPKALRAAVQQEHAAPSTPLPSSSRVDSDELEQMSASQLSNDLDWSVILHGLDQTPALSITSPNKASIQGPSISIELPTAKGKAPVKKRKAAGPSWTRSKKSKRSQRSSGANFRSSESQESWIKHEEDEEVDDLIVVDTSSEPVARSSPPRESEHDVFVDAPESQVEQPKKKRGRPRKKPRAEEGSVSLSHLSSSQRSRRSMYSVESSAEPEVVEQNVGVDLEDAVDESLVQEEIPEPSASDAPAAPPVDVLASLQQVLDHLKDAKAGSVDLRAVDELCFQIRFQAQATGTQ